MNTQPFITRLFTPVFVPIITVAIIATPTFAVSLGNGPASGGTAISIEGIRFTQVAVGETFAIALTNKGTVYTWGTNEFGELGNGTTDPSLVPVQVATNDGNSLTDITAVAAGANFGLALTNSGSVFSWGLNDVGQLGNGTNIDSWYATPVLDINDIFAIDANGKNGYAISAAQGEVFAWGSNSNGQLGDNSGLDSNFPVYAQDTNFESSIKGISKISAGASSIYAIGEGGQLWAWGRNNKKQLGDMSTTDRTLPVATQLAGLDLINVVSVSGGSQFALAQTLDGNIYAWGYNVNGSTGLGTQTGNSNVTRINSLSGIAEIYASGTTSFALRSDGSFYSWGSGVNKTLGDNGSTRSTPILVTPAVPLASLTDGTNSILGLDASGNIYGWGFNSTGIIGDGTMTVRPTPTLGINFLANGIYLDGISATDFSVVDNVWSATVPAGLESATVVVTGEVVIRSGTTTVASSIFEAGSFSYDAALVVVPPPEPSATPTPEATPSLDPTPTPDASTPAPDFSIEPTSGPTPTETAEPSATPSATPTPEVTAAPTPEPTATPTEPVVDLPVISPPETPRGQTAVAPRHATHPAVRGKANVHKVLTTSTGAWTGYPIPTKTIQWYRCTRPVVDGLTALPSSAHCKPIPGANRAKYTLTKNDVSKYVIALVKARNSIGSQAVSSASTKKVKK